jgi:hypothetical protein
MTYVYIKASTTCRYKSKPNILYKACMLFHVRGLTPVVHNWLFGPFPARPNLLYDFWMAALIQSIQTEAQWQSWIVCACAYSTFNCRENKGQRVKPLVWPFLSNGLFWFSKDDKGSKVSKNRKWPVLLFTLLGGSVDGDCVLDLMCVKTGARPPYRSRFTTCETHWQRAYL